MGLIKKVIVAGISIVTLIICAFKMRLGGSVYLVIYTTTTFLFFVYKELLLSKENQFSIKANSYLSAVFLGASIALLINKLIFDKGLQYTITLSVLSIGILPLWIKYERERKKGG